MLILFCISLILGAVLFYSFHLSLVVIALISVIVGAIFCLFVRGKKSVVVGLAIGATVILGALRMWMIPTIDVPIGSKAFVGTIKSIDERLDKTLLKIRVDDTNADIQVTLREKQDLLPGTRFPFVARWNCRKIF